MLSRCLTPEQAELDQRRLELSALRAALVRREHELADLRARLLSFEGRYIRQVGKLYAQLDEWEKKIAELDSPLLAQDLETEEVETGKASRDGWELAGAGCDAQEADVDLRTLFRELARRVHPDFASDTDDLQQRTRLMAQANDAFRRQDADMLQRMLNGHAATSPRESVAVELARVIAQLARVESDTLRIDAEIETLAHSQLARLQERTAAAAQKGRDLLAEMAARVKGNIGMAMRRYELDLERRKRKQAAFDPTELLSAETAPTSLSRRS